MTPNFSIVLLFLTFLAFGVSQIIKKDEKAKVNRIEIKARQVYRSRSNRNRRPVSFKIDGDQYDINFEKSDRQVYLHDTPVWLVKSKPGHSPNYTYERVPNTENFLDGHVYVDNAKKAVAFLRYNYEIRKIVYEGVVGENTNLRVIKPSTNRKYRLQNNGGNHLIYKPKFQESTDILLQKRKSRVAIEGYLDEPLETMYPKLLVVVDNHLFKKLGSDVKKAMTYVVNFWNHVDQKYLEIDIPKIEIFITGIIIADDEKALNYVYQSRTNPEEGNIANAGEMYERTRLYFHHNFSKDVDFQNYDVAVVLTGLDTSPIAGSTMLSYVCDNWYNDAIVRDDGLYGGTGTAAHELAHLLSVQHDKYSKEGECPTLTEDGDASLMLPIQRQTDNYFWSECTKKQLREFAKKKAAECLATRYRERHYEKDPYYDY